MRNLAQLLVLLACTAPVAAFAQSSSQMPEEEHRYQFVVEGALEASAEKILLGSITVLDPRMHVNVDHTEQIMKVLAYQPIEPEALIDIASDLGVVLTHLRPDGDAPILTE